MATSNMMVKPTNKIVLDSNGLHSQVMKVENATNMYPGRAVGAGTNDDDCVVGAAVTTTGIIGFIGYEQMHKLNRPATVDTIHTVNSQVPILWGPGAVIVARLHSGVTAVKGSLLTPVHDGMLTGGTGGTDDIVATSEETVSSVAITAGVDCLVKLRI